VAREKALVRRTELRGAAVCAGTSGYVCSITGRAVLNRDRVQATWEHMHSWRDREKRRRQRDRDRDRDTGKERGTERHEEERGDLGSASPARRRIARRGSH
jgi:hypothetical protein